MKKKPQRSKEKLLIVGNGMVSQRLCSKLVEYGALETYDLTVVGEEPEAAYDRVHLTDYFQSGDLSTIRLNSRDWYQKNRIELILNERVASIDTSSQIALAAQGQSLPYDKLILCTGSSAFVPPIPGIELEGVFVYRTTKDVDAIKAYSRNAKRAVILGGGLLGLEAANALQEQGLDTHVLERANGLMPRQLNEEGSSVLENQLRERGLKLHIRQGLEKIERYENQLLLHLADGSTMRTDVLVLSVGIRPRDELARSANLNVGVRGGIQTSDELQTSSPQIYAIGECALHRGQIYGFIAPGYQMADALAKSLTGTPTPYEGSDLSCRLKLLGVEVSAFGDYLGEGKTLVFKSIDAYRMVILRRDRLIGGTVVGAWENTHQLQLAIQENQFLTPSEQNAFVSTGEIPISDALSDWPANAIVCNCTQTTKGKLVSCIERGCRTIDSLSAETGAGTICGSCRPILGQLVGADAAEAAYKPKGRKLLWGSAILATLICAAYFLAKPFPVPDTVQDTYYSITKLWTDSLYKQISGYTMASLSLIALGLSARKRLKPVRFGNFGYWRAVHAILGLGCLTALIAHTGLNFGDNLNRLLMLCFIALNALGGIAGASLAMEDRLNGPISRRIRTLLTRAHILFFWPYPILLGFHIFKVYYY
ncbi:MAG: FAD-dependent oxidoreductase [Verrucomicrobiota bacterium]